jgi:tetratricopeptide (TPR) repeat protein
LVRVLAVYIGASFATIEVVDILIESLGLPDWILPGAIVLLLLGLPIIVTTALVQAVPEPVVKQEQETRDSPGLQPATAGAEAAAASKHWLTWRRAIMGGLLAFALLGVTVTGYTVMRVLGIGPVASLVAAGTLDPQERIILADFESHAGDSALAVVVTEAFRIDLTQSPLVRIAEPQYVSRVLGRMEKAPDSQLDLELAREVAVREGLKAVIAGDIGTAGTSYVLTVQLVSADTGEPLASFRETAKDAESVVEAIDRLSKKLREKIGESLKEIRRNEPLAKVTTASLEALQKYSLARRAIWVEGDQAKAKALLDEAIAADSTFGSAHTLLGVILSNSFEERERATALLTRAFELRDEMTERERYMASGLYYDYVEGDRERAITAYRTLLDAFPHDAPAMNNLGGLYYDMRDWEQATELYRRAIETDSGTIVPYGNTIQTQVALGRFDEAKVTADRMAEKFPGHPWIDSYGANLALVVGDTSAARAHADSLMERWKQSPFWLAGANNWLANLSRLGGKLSDSERHVRSAVASDEGRDADAEALGAALQLAWHELWFRNGPTAAMRRVDELLERYPLDSIAPLDRPYTMLATLLAAAGEARRASTFITEFETTVNPELRRTMEGDYRWALGWIALTEGRHSDAIGEFRRQDEVNSCPICSLPNLALAYNMAGEPDSAIAVYERYVATPWLWRLFNDSWAIGRAYEQLAVLYEGRRETDKAIYYHGKLVGLWQDADSELQPRVESARRAIQALSTDR